MYDDYIYDNIFYKMNKHIYSHHRNLFILYKSERSEINFSRSFYYQEQSNVQDFRT